MGELNITGAAKGEVADTITSYSVDTVQLDNPSEQKETRWQNTNWTQQLGYYKTIPELQAAINAKEYWTVGKGVKANEMTEMLLDTIKGNGKQTFNTILGNMIKQYCIGGDAYAEIVRNEDEDLININPLDPGSIVIISNKRTHNQI